MSEGRFYGGVGVAKQTYIFVDKQPYLKNELNIFKILLFAPNLLSELLIIVDYSESRSALQVKKLIKKTYIYNRYLLLLNTYIFQLFSKHYS